MKYRMIKLPSIRFAASRDDYPCKTIFGGTGSVDVPKVKSLPTAPINAGGKKKKIYSAKKVLPSNLRRCDLSFQLLHCINLIAVIKD
jgi:hypothetical protein